MSPAELFDALHVLAGEVGLEVRPAGTSGDAPQTSGVCRLRDRIWVVLASADPLEARIGVLAAALREHAGEACAERYLPPAVRAAVDGEF